MKNYTPGKVEHSTKCRIFLSILRQALTRQERVSLFSQSVATLDILQVRVFALGGGPTRSCRECMQLTPHAPPPIDHCVCVFVCCHARFTPHQQRMVERETVESMGPGGRLQHRRVNMLRIDGSTPQVRRHEAIRVSSAGLLEGGHLVLQPPS